MPKTRRLRQYHIREKDLLLFLNWAKRAPQYISVPKFSTGVPDGAEVEHFYVDYDRCCLSVVVSHPSFAEVPDGSPIPHEDGYCEMQSMQVAVKPIRSK